MKAQMQKCDLETQGESLVHNSVRRSNLNRRRTSMQQSESLIDVNGSASGYVYQDVTLQGTATVPLSEGEVVQLQECEKVIEKGYQSVFQMGMALVEIRDSRLYRETHRTFDDYCRTRWEMSRIHAYRMLAAAKVIGLLPVGKTNSGPKTEAQVRPLTSLEPDLVPVAWNCAVEKAAGGKITARHVREAAVEVLKRSDSDAIPRVLEIDHPSIRYSEHLVIKELSKIRVFLKESSEDQILEAIERIKIFLDRIYHSSRQLENGKLTDDKCN